MYRKYYWNRKKKRRKVTAYDERRGKIVETTTKNPNCVWENGTYVIKAKTK